MRDARHDALSSVMRLSPRLFRAQALRRPRFELSCLTRLHVMPAAAKFAEDSRLQDLALERLQGPLKAVGFCELDFWQMRGASLASWLGDVARDERVERRRELKRRAPRVRAGG